MQVELEAPSRLRGLLIVAVLVAGDIGTTILDQHLLGARFLELGSVNGIMIKHFGSLWFLPAYGFELLEFAGSAALCAWIWPRMLLNLKIAKLDLWHITYLLLVGLIANNLVVGFILGRLF